MKNARTFFSLTKVVHTAITDSVLTIKPYKYHGGKRNEQWAYYEDTHRKSE